MAGGDQDALMRMTPAVIASTREALSRARSRRRYDSMQDDLMANGVEWGKGVTGQMPPDNSTYKIHDNPARAHLQALYDQSIGGQVMPSKAERQTRHEELLEELFSDT